MGYTTDFDGKFGLDRPLEPGHQNYLIKFNETRRMRRDAGRTVARPDPVRENAHLPVGTDGGYFVGARGSFGQEYDADDVLDSNNPPEGQPSLWCQWRPTDDGTAIVWDGGEKFNSYVEWLRYLIENFLSRWGYRLNGQMTWQGEEPGDRGTIYVQDNVVKAMEDIVVCPEPEWD